MSVEYAGDGEVEPARLHEDIRDCHQRLAAVIDEIPNDADGERSPAAAVIEEVFAFLGALADDLDIWCDRRFVEIEERLHERLWAFCREQEKAHEDRGIEAEALMRAVVNVVVDDAMAKPIDLQGAVNRYYPRIGRRLLRSDAWVEAPAPKSDPTAGQSGRTATAQRAHAPAKVIAGKGRRQRRPARR